MAMDLLPSKKLQSVRRCLFGTPDRNDEFLRTRREVEAGAALRFKRKWNIEDDEMSGTGSGEIRWIKSSSESSIPDFYRRGFPHKCRRRAVRPCVGKSLSFLSGDSDDESCLPSRVRSQSPLQYFCDASIVDVFLGMRLPHQSSPQEPVTPTSTELQSSPTTPEDSTPVLSDSDSPVRSSTMQRSLSQTRLTDLWPIRKRARSISNDQRQSKRERMDSL